MGSQKIRHKLVTKQQNKLKIKIYNYEYKVYVSINAKILINFNEIK